MFFFYFKLWRPSCLLEWNEFSYFGRDLSRHIPVKFELHWPKGLGGDSI